MMGQFAARKLFLALFGTALLASASVGGWILWSSTGAAGADAVPSNVPVDSPPTGNDVVKTPSIEEKKVVAAAKPASKKLGAVEQEPQAEAPPTKGKEHDRQQVLLQSMVQNLHSEAYSHFISQPGMGISRMMPTKSVLPREWKMPEWTSEELAKEPSPQKGAKDLSLIHRLSLRNFGDSNTKTQEERGAGNAPTLPKKDHLWEIKSLDLVGLVMHETPVVYISEKIPEMKDLQNRPTREMDLFESEGLEELANGKDLYIRSKHSTIRVLGPVHAAKACLKCHHDSKEGDLLGAFSYTLREGNYQLNGRGRFNPGLQPGNLAGHPKGLAPVPLPAPKK